MKAVAAQKATPQKPSPAKAGSGALAAEKFLGPWVIKSVETASKDGKKSRSKTSGSFDFKADGSFSGIDIYGKAVSGKWRLAEDTLTLSSADGSRSQDFGDLVLNGSRLTMLVIQDGTTTAIVFEKNGAVSVLDEDRRNGDCWFGWNCNGEPRYRAVSMKTCQDFGCHSFFESWTCHNWY